MEIQKIDSISLVVDNPLSRSVQDFPRLQPEPSKKPWIKVPDTPKEITTQFSDEAVRLQQLDQQMNQIEKTASSLKEEMNTIRRTLPPFPPGSQERVRLLKSYIGLRKLIEDLTIPPEDLSVRLKEGISLPEINENASDQDWDKAISALDKTQATIHQKRISKESGIEI